MYNSATPKAPSKRARARIAYCAVCGEPIYKKPYAAITPYDGAETDYVCRKTCFQEYKRR
jgi:hypothetical protein